MNSYTILSQIENSTTEEEFNLIIKEMAFFLEAANITYTRFEDKSLLTQACVKFYAEERVRVELDR